MEEGGQLTQPEVGTPQEPVISPLLANIYLHYVFDLWALRWRRRTARGDMVIARYADDTFLGLEHREEAERFPAELRARVEQFGLSLYRTETDRIAGEPGILHTVMDALEHAEKAILEERRRL